MLKSLLLPGPAILITGVQQALALPTSNFTTAIASPPPLVPVPSCNELLRCRTLAGLVWSCLNTVFLCTWVTMHPNVPAKESSSLGGRIFSSRLGLVGLMLVSPELVVLLASSEWASASVLITTLSQKYSTIRWTETHGMMLVMGGFEVLKENDSSDDPGPQKSRLTVRNIETDALDGCEADLSTITEDMIKDKSKGEAVAKALVVLQTAWFAIQCAARVSQQLPVTKLELTTLGHTVFTSIIYFFWWNKPVCVRYPITLHAKLQKNVDTEGTAGGVVIDSDGHASDEQSDASLPQIKEDPDFKAASFNLPWRIRFGTYLTSSKIVDFRPHRLLPSVLRINFEVVMMGAFGAIHCLGWNSQFPSHVEHILWCASAVIVTTLPGIILVLSYGRWESGKMDSAPVCGISNVIVIILMCLYICARASLGIVAFLSLRDLPLGAYQTPSWTTIIPHL